MYLAKSLKTLNNLETNFFKKIIFKYFSAPVLTCLHVSMFYPSSLQSDRYILPWLLSTHTFMFSICFIF